MSATIEAKIALRDQEAFVFALLGGFGFCANRKAKRARLLARMRCAVEDGRLVLVSR